MNAPTIFFQVKDLSPLTTSVVHRYGKDIFVKRKGYILRLTPLQEVGMYFRLERRLTTKERKKQKQEGNKGNNKRRIKETGKGRIGWTKKEEMTKEGGRRGDGSSEKKARFFAAKLEAMPLDSGKVPITKR